MEEDRGGKREGGREEGERVEGVCPLHVSAMRYSARNVANKLQLKLTILGVPGLPGQNQKGGSGVDKHVACKLTFDFVCDGTEDYRSPSMRTRKSHAC